MRTKQIATHWDEVLRLATSVKAGTVAASLILGRLAAYPRRNGLAWALKEIGKMERSIFYLGRTRGPDLRRRVTAGLNKGEARNALARARGSGLTGVTDDENGRQAVTRHPRTIPGWPQVEGTYNERRKARG